MFPFLRWTCASEQVSWFYLCQNTGPVSNRRVCEQAKPFLRLRCAALDLACDGLNEAGERSCFSVPPFRERAIEDLCIFARLRQLVLLLKQLL